MSRAIVHRPGFLDDLLALDGGSVKQILDKCTMLQESPDEEGKSKKRLDGRSDGLHRLRSGDFRIFYTFDEEKVSLWAVRRKTVKGQYRGQKGGDVTYDGIDSVEDDDLDVSIPQLASTSHDVTAWMSPTPTLTSLPEPITVELLEALRVPAHLHTRLTAISDQESLLDCPGVPEDLLLAIDRHMFDEPLDLRGEQPELYAAGGVDDLLRFAEGEVVPFLLRLNAEQERLVRWALDAEGPTLVKGGPGTGKSTVAIYRAREMIGVLRAGDVEHPSILFTTYTNALVTFSRQLIGSLLGEDAAAVTVQTVDKLVAQILRNAGESTRRPDAASRSKIQKQAFATADMKGNVLQQSAQRSALDRLGHAYLFEEIQTVIHGRGIHRLDDYLAAPRPGRRVPLRETQRRAVWAVAETYGALLEQGGYQTWEQARSRAAEIAATRPELAPSFDAVIVDEAQDLDAGALRLLVTVCSAPNRLFITADESQSIYAAGFGWSDVHTSLRFRGRTGVLRANHRSTREVTEAARDYLAAGLDDDLVPDAQTYIHSGPPPAVRRRGDRSDEIELLARFLRGASRELRLTIGSGAVLVPDKFTGRPIARALTELGVPASYSDSREFQLDDNAVTVLPLRAAKGLEFPIVAIAGLIGSSYPHLPDGSGDETSVDALVRERRTLFVCMTRAMRALLIITPLGHDSILFDGFDPNLWNCENE